MVGLMRAGMLAAAILGSDAIMGGWAVVSVENPPLSLEAGGEYRLEFTIRQHGVEPMADLKPTVVVATTRGVASQTVAAAPGNRKGRYVATFRAPAADSAELRIEANWHEARLTLMPIAIVPKGSAAPVMALAEWGRRVYVAKSCGTCHLNGDVPEFAARNESMKVGPELTGRRLEAAYVRQRITNPASLPSLNKWNRMPDLGLSASEADALVALLTGPVRAAIR